MKKITQVISVCISLLLLNKTNAQTPEKRSFQSSLMIGHDIFLPLFGNAFESSDVQKIIKRDFFIPVAMYEFTFNSRWRFGIKAGYQNYGETKRQTTNVSAPGVFDEFYNNESIWGVNVYGKYVMRQDKKLQPYVGTGFGYQVIRQKEINQFASGTETKNIRKYGEFSFLLKGGIMYSLSKRLALFSEGEYRPVPAVWVTGIAIKL